MAVSCSQRKSCWLRRTGMQRISPLWMVGDPPPRLLPCGLDVAVGSCVWACCPAGPGAGMPRPAGSWAEPLLEGGPVGVSCVPGTRVAVVAVGSHTATPAEAGAHGVAPGATLSARSSSTCLHVDLCRQVRVRGAAQPRTARPVPAARWAVAAASVSEDTEWPHCCREFCWTALSRGASERRSQPSRVCS